MKVVHINTLDTGGAATAAHRIHAGLQNAGIDSQMLVLKQTRRNTGVFALPCATNGHQCLQRLFNRWNVIGRKYPRRPKGLELFSDTHAEVSLAGLSALEEADIVHLHWVAGVVNYDELPAVCQGKALVWTLHDMNPFTGGCHYAGSCLNYRQQCGKCPQLGSPDEDDLARRIWKKKAGCYANLAATIVTPSRWLGDCAKQSSLMREFQIEVIPYGLPADVFRPRKDTCVRQRWGIPDSARIVLFGAEAADNPRKGLHYLIDALQLLVKQQFSSKNLWLLVFGNNPAFNGRDLPFRMVSTGMIDNPQLLSEIYAVADAFVIPSVEDNLPNTALEALACGTPVVGFRAGGIADIVDHLQTGYLADIGNANQLAAGIRWVLEEIEKGTPFLKRCREKAEIQYASEVQAQAYAHLYEKIWRPQSWSVRIRTKKIETFPSAGTAWPKISIVTPSYNQSRYLEACIRSVLDQNYPNIEYIVMDGGSTDSSKEIIEQYADCLAYWRSGPDQGQYWAIQDGFRRSTGDIMTWLNADDVFDPHAFRVAAAIFMQRSEIEWITGRQANIDAPGKKFSISSQLVRWSQKKYLDKEYHHPFIQQEGTFWRRKLWERAGAKLDLQLALAGDLELWARFLRHAQMFSIDYATAFYRVHSENKALKFMQQYMQEAEKVIEREIGLFRAEQHSDHLRVPLPVSKKQIAEYVSITEPIFKAVEDHPTSVPSDATTPIDKASRFCNTIANCASAPPLDRTQQPKVTSRLLPVPAGDIAGYLKRFGGIREKTDTLTITFILPTKNRAGGLMATLACLADSMRDIPHEIILYADKESEDIRTCQEKYRIEKVFYDTGIFSHGEPFSWSKLMNHAFSQASGQWIMYGSDDIALYPNCFRNALELLQSRKDGSIGGISFLHRNTDETYGGFFTDFGYDTLNGDKPFINFGLIKAEAFAKTRGFDEKLRFFWADVDICAQILCQGYTIIASLGSFVDHHNILEREQKEKRIALFERDTAYFYSKWRADPLFANQNPLDKVRYTIGEIESRNIMEVCGCSQKRHIDPAARQKTKVVVDGVIFQLQAGRAQGIYRVWRNLIPELMRWMPDAEFTILQRKGSAIPLGSVKTRTVPAFRLGNVDAFDEDDDMLRGVCLKLKADLFISTYFTRAPGVINVIMVHDLIPEKLGFDLSQPEWVAKQRAVETADAFICVSHTTQKDLAAFYPHTAKRPVLVAYHGLDSSFRIPPADDVNGVRSKLNLSRPYVMLVGNRHGYKNGIGVLAAMADMKADEKPIVLCVGGEYPLSASEIRLKEKLDIRYAGRLNDKELAAAYGGALALLVPSRYEGFGLPVLEALACGCPVIAHASPAVCEIGADAVCYADMNSTAEISKALKSIVQTSHREACIQNGYKRAHDFSWQATASSVQGFMQALIDRPSVLVTAIVSTYNAEKFISGCLEDLQNQTIAAGPLEIIVIDSASEENEAAIVRDFQGRCTNIKYIRTASRENVYAAWNRGIKLAQGKYITNANTDDRHRREAFEQMAAVLDAEPEVALVYADVIKTSTANETFERCTPTGMLAWHDWNRQTLLERGCFMGPQPMWRRQVHDIFGYFDETLTVAGDYEFWLRISQLFEFKRIARPLGLYLERADSVEHAHAERKRQEEREVNARFRQAAQRGELLSFQPFLQLRRAVQQADAKITRDILHQVSDIGRRLSGACAERIDTAGRRLAGQLKGQGALTNELAEYMSLVGRCFLSCGRTPITAPIAGTHEPMDAAADAAPNQGGRQMKFADQVYNVIQMLLERDQREIAHWILRKLLTDFPDHAAANHNCAVRAHADGDMATAAQHFRRAAELSPGNADFQKSLGDFLHVVQNDPDAAIAQYRKVLALRPRDLAACLTIAHLNVSHRRFDEAVEYYRKVLELDPSHGEARACLAKLKALKTRQTSPAELHMQVRRACESGDKQSAVRLLSQIIAQDPDDAVAHNDLGVLYFETGRKDLSQFHYEKAAELAPENVLFQKNLGDFYYVEQGQIEKALRKYVQALTLEPQDIETLLSTGHICISLGRPEDARVFLNRILEIEPWNEQAVRLLDQVNAAGVTAASGGGEELYSQAQTLSASGDPTGAANCLRRLIAENPDHAAAYNDLGVIHYELGEKTKALQFYEQAVRLNGKNPTFLKNLADFYYVEQGRAQDALKIYVQLLETNREDVDCLLAAGAICAGLDKEDDARVFFERVLQIDPRHQQANDALRQMDMRRAVSGRAAAVFEFPRSAPDHAS